MSTKRYAFSEDKTLINGKYYHELLWSGSMTGEITHETGKFYREEGQKVWLMSPSRDSAVLLYDFSLDVGDTFKIYNSVGMLVTYVVTIKQTLTFSDGSVKHILKLKGETEQGYNCEIRWIEGMGSIVAFMDYLHVCVLDGIVRYVLCFTSNGKLLYRDPSYGSCYVTATESPELADLKLYPNPTSDKLSFNTEYKIKSVEIYDLMGHKIKEISFPGKAIDIGMYQAGVYFIHIRTANGYRGVRKFIIN